MRVWLVVVAVALAGCETFGAPYEKDSHAVEGCDAAVAHLRSCCPRFNSYVSCRVTTSATLSAADLSESQSRCLAKLSCAEIERGITRGDRPCGFAAPTQQCR
jgi:hypothetical protein